MTTARDSGSVFLLSETKRSTASMSPPALRLCVVPRSVYGLVSLEVSPGDGWRSLTVALGGAPVATVSG